MRGIPKSIRTRGDIDNLRAYIGTDSDTPEARAIIIAELNAIRATYQHYQFTRLLASESDRAGPDPEYRVLAGQGAASDEIREYHLTDSPHSRLNEIGMTLAELDQLIAEIY